MFIILAATSSVFLEPEVTTFRKDGGPRVKHLKVNSLGRKKKWFEVSWNYFPSENQHKRKFG